MAGAGTFAEEMIIPHQGVVKIDDDIPLEIGSLVGCGVMTGVGAAINTAKVTPGSLGRGVRLRRRRDLLHHGRQGRRRLGHRGRRPQRREARGRQAASAPPTPASPTSSTASRPASPAATASTTPSRPSACPRTMRAAYDAIRRGGTACIVGVGKLDEFVQLLRLRAVLLREEPRRLLLRLGRRAHRLPQAARLLQGRHARRSTT